MKTDLTFIRRCAPSHLFLRCQLDNNASSPAATFCGSRKKVRRWSGTEKADLGRGLGPGGKATASGELPSELRPYPIGDAESPVDSTKLFQRPPGWNIAGGFRGAQPARERQSVRQQTAYEDVDLANVSPPPHRPLVQQQPEGGKPAPTPTFPLRGHRKRARHSKARGDAATLPGATDLNCGRGVLTPLGRFRLSGVVRGEGTLTTMVGAWGQSSAEERGRPAKRRGCKSRRSNSAFPAELTSKWILRSGQDDNRGGGFRCALAGRELGSLHSPLGVQLREATFSRPLAQQREVAARAPRAFTLIELLLVIGVIAILSGGVGLALQENGSRALSGAQITLAGLIATTRAVAAVHQTEARLLISAERPPAGDAEKFLRQLQVVRADPGGTGAWRAVGNPVFLPRGIYLVPDSTEGLLAPGVVWQTSPAVTSTLGTPTFSPVLDSGVFGSAYWLEFKADGSVAVGTGGETSVRLVLTVGRKENEVPQFSHPTLVCGLVVRPTGAVSFVNDAESF